MKIEYGYYLCHAEWLKARLDNLSNIKRKYLENGKQPPVPLQREIDWLKHEILWSDKRYDIQ